MKQQKYNVCLIQSVITSIIFIKVFYLVLLKKKKNPLMLEVSLGFCFGLTILHFSTLYQYNFHLQCALSNQEIGE